MTRQPTGVIICSRGSGPGPCPGIGHEARVESFHRLDGWEDRRVCPKCGAPVETYETVDGRHLVMPHKRMPR